MLLQSGYLVLSLIMTLLLIGIGRYGILKTFNEPAKAKKKIRILVMSLVGWHLYIFALSASGFLRTFEFPPRFVLLLIVPAFAFTAIFAFQNRNAAWLKAIPKKWLIYYQSFRVGIELLFVFSVTANVLHPNVTIEGYNYDMVFGFSAILVGLIYSRNPVKFKKLAIAWNYLGLAVIAFIIFLFITTIFFPSFYGFKAKLMPLAFTEYPYIMVAGFLMPSAVFAHVLSLIQLHTPE